VIELREKDQNSVMSSVIHAFDKRLAIGQKLEAKMNEVRSSIFSFFSNFMEYSDKVK
jgi:hypothetical protein